MVTLGIILARTGSKGLPGKCVRELLGRKLIEYTFDHAKASKLLTHVVLTTDCEEAKELARAYDIEVIDRPAELATDTATVDAAARHAVEEWERSHEATKPRSHEGVGTEASLTRRVKDRLRHEGTPPLNPPLVRGEARRVDIFVLLYGNIPVRRAGLIDEAIEKLIATGADSVRSVAPVTKQHPDWVHRLEGDRMVQFRPNSIYRRQDLAPLFYHDGAIVVVTRAALFGALQTPDDKQAFLGRDRRAIVCEPEDAVDVDTAVDLHLAEAVLRQGQRRSDEATKRRRLENCRLSMIDCRLAIAGREVGGGARTFVIAEAGVNHNGDILTALRMVETAKQCGADAVKFQMFRAAELASTEAPAAAYQHERCGATSQREMLSKLELSDREFARIARRCDEVGIALVITPFGVEDVARIQTHCSQSSGTHVDVKEFDGSRGLKPAAQGVAAIKIASTDLTNGPLIDAAARTELPMIVSTGASTLDEIRAAVERISALSAGDRLVLLHCVSCYPTPGDAINLRAIQALGNAFRVPAGLSDHTTSTQTGGWAVAAGARVLEKHFTLDKSAAGPDHAMSLSPLELTEYVRAVREAERALGTGEVGVSHLEEDVRRAARKSVVAAQAIGAGTRITPEMLTLKRPGTGIEPDRMGELLGRHASIDIPGDTLLSWKMVK
jgi:N-acetylneuraminate synthase/N,N'-diacetyllegionaminate synthase